MPSARRRQDFLFDAAADQRIFDLQVEDRMHRCGAADGLAPISDRPMCAHIAGAHHVGDRADRLLDRHARVEPRRAVDVDIVGVQPLAACRPESSSRPRAGRRARSRRRRGRAAAELHRDQRLARGTPSSAPPISISLWPMP